MPYTLVMNSSNVISNNNTAFKYDFINGAFVVPENSEMCISQIVIPYSWFNLNKGLYNNTSFQYYWGATLWTMEFLTGFYSVQDLNNYMQNVFISRNQYLVNKTSNYNEYFISVQTSQTYYANQFIMFPIPSSLPLGYTSPAGFVYNPSGTTPQVQILSTNNFYKIVGFSAGLYPSVATTAINNVLSDITPNATEVNSIIVRCDIINNECAFPSDILDVFSINATFGSNITYSPPYEKWVSVSPGRYSSMMITFQDQNFGVIEARDPNLLIAVLLRTGKSQREIKQDVINKPLVPILRQLKFKDEYDYEKD